MHSIMLERENRKYRHFDRHVKWIDLNRSDWMEVQNRNIPRSYEWNIRTSFLQNVAVIPTRITIEQLNNG